MSTDPSLLNGHLRNSYNFSTSIHTCCQAANVRDMKLNVKSVSVHYKMKRTQNLLLAADRINFAVEAGEFVAIRFSYGTSEVQMITEYLIEKTTDFTEQVVPAGYITGDREILIANDQEEECSTGEVGEIVIRKGSWSTKRRLMPCISTFCNMPKHSFQIQRRPLGTRVGRATLGLPTSNDRDLPRRVAGRTSPSCAP